MASKPDRERREFPRMWMRLALSYRVVESVRGGQSLTKNVGGRGIRFLTDQPLHLGTKLEITLSPPDRPKPIIFVGEVVWSEMRHDPAYRAPMVDVGVRFVKIDPRDQQFLVQYSELYGSSESPEAA